jgi:LuxR family maltose regulon positive regulatory protein
MHASMAGTDVRTVQQGTAAAPDRLLATKLHVPRPRPRSVMRGRLLDRLESGLHAGLTLVAAPAGFGKSSLLADWARAGRHRVAWLSVDAADNDPARFWRHVGAALDGVCPDIAEPASSLLGPPSPASWDAYVTVLINGLAARGTEVVLVLDDYDRVQAEAVETSFVFLLEHRPPGLHVALACRADPRLPLARLRARGELVELRAADLRFTTAEAAELLRGAVDVDVPIGAIRALEERTEGWAAGLHLAALSLRGRSDIARFVEDFGASNRFVLDYLMGEVLGGQPDDVRTFLLETSVLDRLSAELCDTVTGRTDGQEMLEAIDAANLFLVPLDDVRGWWRYHHLFADLLRARLQYERPERWAEVQRIAARAARDARGRQGGATIPGLVEALSARELEVLGLVAVGRPNRAIAAELFVTLDTVKKHVTHMIGKLGATNRTEAVARARELGVIH